MMIEIFKIRKLKRFVKSSLILVLTLSWLLTGWPGILKYRIKNIEYRFPPKSEEVKAAAATGLYCEKVTDTTANSTTWVDVCEISAGSFTVGKTYLIIASLYLANSGAASEARVRLVRGGTPTVFTDASAAYEMTGMTASAGNRTAYGYMTVYTQPGTAELVKLQISNSSTDTTTAEMGQIFALKLSDDLVQNTDWCYTEVTADYSTETAFSDTSSTDAASCALTANGTDNYLAIANAMVDVAATNSNYMMSLYESVAGTDEPAINVEGEDATNEFRSHLLARTYTPSAASHTWYPRFNDETVTHVIMSSRIFVLKLNKFSQNSFSYLVDEEQPAATTNWTTTRTLSVTPEVTGNWFILGTFTNDVGTLTDDLFTRLQVNDGGGLASDPNYGDNAPHEDSWDATDDVVPFQIFKMRSLTSGAARTINLDVQMNSGTTLRVQERHLVAFSLELSPSYLTQNDFEFWEDSTALIPTSIWGNPDISENTALMAVPPANDPIDPSDEMRLRMNVSVTITDLASGTEGFILAYSEAQDCTTASSWTDIDAAGGGGTWRFSSDTDIPDPTTLTTLLVSTSETAGRYSRSDPTSTNPNTVTAGQEMEWDWHIQYNGLASAATYCFRIERDDGTTLSAYNSDSYPRVDIRPGIENLLRHGNFFSTGIERGFFWAD